MKRMRVKNDIAGFPHPILPTVQGEPDYHAIRAIQKLLWDNARAIDTHAWGGDLGHLCIIVSVVAYTIVALTTP
jgi:hypothetical protein